MLLSKEPYSRESIENILNYLRRYREKGNPIDYEIIVDKFKAVRRTNDPEDFSMFEDFIKGHTRSMEVLLYTGTSNNNDKYIFTFIDEPKGDGALSGIEIDNRIQDQVSKARQEWDYERTREKLTELEEEVEELEQEVAKLEKEKAELVAGQSPLKGILGEVGSSFIESMIRRNPQILTSLPGGTALAGIIEEDNRRLPELSDTETEVTFKAKTPSDREAEKASITFVRQLKENFSKEEFDQVLTILEAMVGDKNHITSILNIIK